MSEIYLSLCRNPRDPEHRYEMRNSDASLPGSYCSADCERQASSDGKTNSERLQDMIRSVRLGYRPF